MKAILVIDMPKSCGECKLYMNNGNSYWCSATGIDTTGFTIPASCPLKPMPKHYPSTSNPQRIEYLKQLGMTEKEQHYYELGHDDCIDELLGEEE